ncbi:MAG: cobalamin biosynthesis protein P47K, partial [Planctomycetales bacterium]
TETLRRAGLEVGEVAGACFCCKFNDLVETLGNLAADQQPDVVLAEPVGSCTDLVATVVEPLRRLHGDRYDLGAYAVLAKPEHGRKILGGGRVGFSPKAAYIFKKQLEEADLVVINKIDKLDPSEQQELLDLIKRTYPNKETLAVSARRGDGLDALLSRMMQTDFSSRAAMEVDYDVYAEGEAELGWLNCRVVVNSADGDAAVSFSLDEFVLELARLFHQELTNRDAETAHLKILGASGEDVAIANSVSSEQEPELSMRSSVAVDSAELIVNARVATDPEELAEIVRGQLAEIASSRGLQVAIHDLRSFRPGRPVPTHRDAPEQD